MELGVMRGIDWRLVAFMVSEMGSGKVLLG
jgi:hypothetical protein